MMVKLVYKMSLGVIIENTLRALCRISHQHLQLVYIVI